MDVSCSTCSAHFRITPQPGEPLPEEIPCPVCGAPIVIELKKPSSPVKEKISGDHYQTSSKETRHLNKATADRTEKPDVYVPTIATQPEESPFVLGSSADSSNSSESDANLSSQSADHESASPQKRSRYKWLFLGLAFLLLGTLIAVKSDDLLQLIKKVKSKGNQDVTAEAKTKKISPEAISQAKKEATRIAILIEEEAKKIGEAVKELRDKGEEDLLAALQNELKKSNYGSARVYATELHRRKPLDPKANEMLVTALLGSGNFKQARKTIASYYGKIEINQRNETLDDLWLDSLNQDPNLPPKPLYVSKDHPMDVDKIKALGGGRSVSLKIYQKGKVAWAYKAEQDEWNKGWRVEIAAYTLCQLLPCSFEVPYSTSLVLSRSSFNELYALDTEKQRNYHDQFYRLHWNQPIASVLEQGYSRRALLRPNETMATTPSDTDWLYGVAKIWVPHFSDWPIEYTEVWRDLLSQESPEQLLDRPVTMLIDRIRAKKYQKTDKIVEEIGGATTRSVAAQLSDLLVFDFLINNWDRFSTVTDYYGVNNQFASGRFVSIDNGAGFHTQASSRVKERLYMSQRFSAKLIAAIRMLDPKTIDHLLFPGYTKDEAVRLAVFWKQRDALLAYVDSLIREYGRDRVLYF